MKLKTRSQELGFQEFWFELYTLMMKLYLKIYAASSFKFLLYLIKRQRQNAPSLR